MKGVMTVLGVGILVGLMAMPVTADHGRVRIDVGRGPVIVTPPFVGVRPYYRFHERYEGPRYYAAPQYVPVEPYYSPYYVQPYNPDYYGQPYVSPYPYAPSPYYYGGPQVQPYYYSPGTSLFFGFSW